MYDPQASSLDFELGAFGDKFKKVVKGAAKGLDKVTDATITKPSAAIGGAIGGKKGRAIGQKLGKLTSTVTKVGIGAGAAGALAGAALPLAGALAPAALPVAAGFLGSKLARSGKKKKSASSAQPTARSGITKSSGNGGLLKRIRQQSKPSYMTKKSDDNALAAKVAAMLVAKLGGPLNAANKALQLADLQRTATYEHKKLMSDADFRKKVLAGITAAAAGGNSECERTIRVLVNR